MSPFHFQNPNIAHCIVKCRYNFSAGWSFWTNVLNILQCGLTGRDLIINAGQHDVKQMQFDVVQNVKENISWK